MVIATRVSNRSGKRHADRKRNDEPLPDTAHMCPRLPTANGSRAVTTRKNNLPHFGSIAVVPSAVRDYWSALIADSSPYMPT
jgi:hypothetical protein